MEKRTGRGIGECVEQHGTARLLMTAGVSPMIIVAGQDQGQPRTVVHVPVGPQP